MMTHPEVALLLPHFSSRSTKAANYGDPRAWIVLAAYEGLRCAEIASRRGEDLEGDRMLVRGKGGTVAYPHRLRHRHATSPLAGGADPRQVQTLMRHASVASTQIYTAVHQPQHQPTYTGLWVGIGPVQPHTTRTEVWPKRSTVRTMVHESCGEVDTQRWGL
jgi:integrase